MLTEEQASNIQYTSSAAHILMQVKMSEETIQLVTFFFVCYNTEQNQCSHITIQKHNKLDLDNSISLRTPQFGKK